MNVKLPLLAGVFKDETPLAATGFYVDAQWCRVNRGKMEVMGGYESATNDSVEGICRGLHAWRDNLSQSYEAIGTHTHLQCYHDGEIYDITPLDVWGQLTNPFDTADTDNTVTVNHTAHGRSIGDRVSFPDGPTVGGLDMTSSTEWTVATVPDANSYTFEHTSAATSTVAGGGGTVDYEYILPIGLVDNIGSVTGYGVAGYGIGGYGQGSSDAEYFPRVWTMDNWGQNLVACPRGGKIYEWAPAFTNSELVTNGDFSAGTDWNLGTGWSIGSGVATAAAGTASGMTQDLTLTAGAYFVLEFDATVSAGTCQLTIEGTNIDSAITATGHYKFIFYNYGNTLSFSKDNTFAGTIDNVSVKQSLRAVTIPNAPTQNSVIWVTDKRILVSAGSSGTSGVFDPLLVSWSDQENNQTWTPTASNQAGFFRLAKGGRVVTGMSGRGENVVWTDKGLYLMRYVPDPNVVYRFDFVGAGCGPISTHAVVMLAGNYYWMANTGEFFRFTGGAPEPLMSGVRKDVFENLSPAQGEKVYAFATSAFKEVGFLYPDARQTTPTECNSYVLYSVADEAFSTGAVDRTAWLDSGGVRFPTAVSSTGSLYFQEKGKSFDGAALYWKLETGMTEIVNGNEIMQIQAFYPDFDDFVGGCTVTLLATIYPQSTPSTASGTCTETTEKIDFLLTGGQMQYRFEGNAAPAFMRTGAPSVDVLATGMGR